MEQVLPRWLMFLIVGVLTLLLWALLLARPALAQSFVSHPRSQGRGINETYTASLHESHASGQFDAGTNDGEGSRRDQQPMAGRSAEP